MKAIHRVFQYLELNNIPPTRFEKEIGIGNGYLKKQLTRNADLGETILNKIIDNCLSMNAIWLLRGEGEMLKNEEK